MARILNIDIPENKRVHIGLTKIYGIGRSKAIEILIAAEVPTHLKVKELSEEQLAKIRQVITKEVTEGELRRNTAYNVKRLMEIGCYRGIRHRKGLPVRGQSTKRNARTRKGPRKTVANKKKVTQKT